MRARACVRPPCSLPSAVGGETAACPPRHPIPSLTQGLLFQPQTTGRLEKVSQGTERGMGHSRPQWKKLGQGVSELAGGR